MRTETKTASIIMAIGILLTLMLPRGYATVYQASDSDNFAYPACSASFAIDDGAHIFSVTWSSAGYILLPVPAVFFWCTWHIWDDLGYFHEDFAAPASGAVTFDDYYNTKTWAHGEVKWTFVFPVGEGIGMYIATAGVTFYVGEGPGGGGGCPYVYMWDGQQYVMDNNLLPASEMSNGADVEDNYKLEQPLVPTYQGRTYSLYSMQIREFEHEHDYLDQVKLLAVDHKSDVNIAVTQQGEILTYKNPSPPLSCLDNNGTSRLYETSKIDGNVSDVSTYFEGYPGDYLILNLGRTASDNAKLILRTDMKKMEECIEVQVQNSSGMWQTVEVLVPRNYWSMEAVNLSSYVNNNEDLMVRLFWKYHHRLDYVGLDTSPQDSFELHYATLISAIHSSEGNVRRRLLENDQIYAELIPTQQIQLTFLLPNNQNQERTFILYTEGHYTNLEG